MKYFAVLKDYLIRFSKKGLSPEEIARGIALGVFIGFIPVIGTHTVIAIGLAALLRLNTLIVLLGTQISNPLFYPFLLFFSAEVGSLLLNGKILHIKFSRDMNYFQHYMMPILTGSLVLGIIMAWIFYLLVKAYLKRKQKSS
jgi:uncharacterized protein (DUF2062 family)